jgi:acetyl esterase/lipase
MDAGYVVLCPSYRGENGNPGEYEMWLGEVDDAAAAIRWLAQHPTVKPDEMYVFGHSSGAIMSASLSLLDDVAVRHTGGAGGMYDAELFQAMRDAVPFDLDDPREFQMRLLIGNISAMQRPHYAFVGTRDRPMRGDIAKEEAARTGAPLHVIEVAGNHSTCLPEAAQKYLEIIRGME